MTSSSSSTSGRRRPAGFHRRIGDARLRHDLALRHLDGIADRPTRRALAVPNRAARAIRAGPHRGERLNHSRRSPWAGFRLRTRNVAVRHPRDLKKFSVSSSPCQVLRSCSPACSPGAQPERRGDGPALKPGVRQRHHRQAPHPRSPSANRATITRPRTTVRFGLILDKRFVQCDTFGSGDPTRCWTVR